jgi:hypothetical protein
MIWAQNLLALGNNWAAENQVTIITTTASTTIRITTTTPTKKTTKSATISVVKVTVAAPVIAVIA